MKISELKDAVKCLELLEIEEIELVAQLNDGDNIHFQSIGMYANKGLNEAVLIFENEKEI